jgi:hypothetical protein
MPGLIVLAGSLAQRPGRGGHSWVFLQYLLGFRHLGWDVLFLDELLPQMCQDRSGTPCPFDRSWNLRYLLQVMERFGLREVFSLSYNRGECVVGLAAAEVIRRVKRCALFINVMGFLSDPDVLAAAPRRVFLDIDPGFGQMWRELGLCDLFGGYHAHVTVGLNVGTPGCGVPACGLDWLPTPQPVVLDMWPAQPAPAAVNFTTVASWRGPFGPVEYRGRTYGLRVHEFRRFADLPRRTGRPFRLALDIDPGEARDLALLAANGWTLVDPEAAAGDPWVYQDFIRSSAAEFAVAKGMYVQTGGGWFSDRSICYLATARPVLAQDTGLRRDFPADRGLLLFSTPEEAVARVEAVCGDYAAHARAARACAEEYFDSDKVLGRLLARLGVA